MCIADEVSVYAAWDGIFWEMFWETQLSYGWLLIHIMTLLPAPGPTSQAGCDLAFQFCLPGWPHNFRCAGWYKFVKLGAKIFILSICTLWRIWILQSRYGQDWVLRFTCNYKLKWLLPIRINCFPTFPRWVNFLRHKSIIFDQRT